MQLMQGDCLELMKEIPDGSIDMVLTDTPYGMRFQSNYRAKKYKRIENDEDLLWLRPLMYEINRVMKKDSVLYMFCSWHNVDVFKREVEKLFKVKNILIWEKNNTSMGDLKGSYAPKYEMVIFAHKGRRSLNGFRHPDVLKFNRTGNKLHPTQKPVDLLKLFIETSSDKGQIILDPFMGSGSTGVACVKTGRDFIGIEIDEGYFEIAKKRIDEAANDRS